MFNKQTQYVLKYVKRLEGYILVQKSRLFFDLKFSFAVPVDAKEKTVA